MRFTGTLNVSFDIVKDQMSNGTYEIITSKANNKALDMTAGSKTSGTQVQMYDWNGTVAQGRKVSHDSKGYVTFINVGSNKAIDVAVVKLETTVIFNNILQIIHMLKNGLY